MQVKIFFNNKPLYLTNTITPEIEEHLHHEETVFIDELNAHTVKAMIHEMEQEKIQRGVFLHENFEDLLTQFKKKFTVIKAGGGLVHDAKKQVLLIFRKGKWDLPKGKLDKGESMEECAVREVKEETGLEKLLLQQPLNITYHTYHEFTKHVLKETQWYLMQGSSAEVLQPQTTEDIAECRWAGIDNLQPYLSNTHVAILDVLQKGKGSLSSAK